MSLKATIIETYPQIPCEQVADPKGAHSGNHYSRWIWCSSTPTYSMVQSPSWEASWLTASQEIPRISRNPKVHHRTNKRPPPASILGQPNPLHTPTSHLLEIRSNIIHPSTPRSPQWSPSLRFPHQDPIHPPLLTHTCHMPSPSHSSRFIYTPNLLTLSLHFILFEMWG